MCCSFACSSRLTTSRISVYTFNWSHRQRAPAMSDIDIREIVQCTCLRLRRTSRRITKIYDGFLEPAGLTVNQFGLLARLYGGRLRGETLTMGMLAERVGMDPT